MKRESNNKFSFVISASGDSWDVCDFTNISRPEAEDIAIEIQKTRGIFDSSDGEYIGETIVVEGKYGSNVLKLNTIASFEYSYVDAVYEDEDILNEKLIDEVLPMILEDEYFEPNKEKQEINNVTLDYYAERDILFMDIETIYSVCKWETYIYVCYLESKEEKKHETLKLKHKIKRTKK